MDKSKIYQEERPWGNFRQFTFGELSTVKILAIKSNESLSLQSHNKRTEFWRVIKGDGKIEIGEGMFEAKDGDEYEIGIGMKHRIIAGQNGVQVLEISTGDFDEKDIVRYEDKYGRV